jgi:hypothetical protein
MRAPMTSEDAASVPQPKDGDIAESHEVTLEELDALSLPVRFRNSFMRLLSYFI